MMMSPRSARPDHFRPIPRNVLTLVIGMLAVFLLAVFAVAATPAQAVPTTPSLSGSHPTSPGISTTPRLYGSVGGVSTSAFGSGPRVSALGAGGGITVYAQPSCGGAEVETGTVSEFSNSGIQVTVAPGSETTFSVTYTEPGSVPSCSNSYTYQQVADPPKPPTVSAVSPASPANFNFPQVSGIADANSTVSIYTNASCSGGPVWTGPASQFNAGGIQVSVADNSTTTFFALASWAELPSGCSSSSVTYQEVTPAEQPGTGTPGSDPAGSNPPVSDPPGKPQPPHLRMIPGAIANDPTPLVSGSAPGASVVRIYGSADCKGPVLVKGSAAQFAAGLAVQIVPNTTVAFYGKSVDGGGDESICSPEPALYTDDSIAPRTRITTAPPAKTVKRIAVFRFADITGGPETNFLCKVDKKPWKPCQAPLRLNKLGHKRHILRVKAYDAAGNHEAKGVKRSFQVVRGR
jgi:hypothetical protein